MFPKNAAFQEYDHTLTEHGIPFEKKQTSELSMEDSIVNYTQENDFFKGILVALPISIAIWVGLVAGINSLYFYLI